MKHLTIVMKCIALVAIISNTHLVTASPPKLIEWGWDTPNTIYLRRNTEATKNIPFDGLILSANVIEEPPDGKKDWSLNLTWRGFGEQKFEYDQFSKIVENLRAGPSNSRSRPSWISMPMSAPTLSPSKEEGDTI